jgi:hypothetical protein
MGKLFILSFSPCLRPFHLISISTRFLHTLKVDGRPQAHLQSWLRTLLDGFKEYHMRRVIPEAGTLKEV